jgi:uncharacterized protein (UPF0548 family)
LFHLIAPSEDAMLRFIWKQKDSAFSYPEVGASSIAVPAGYNVNHNRVRLGSGEVAWQRAKQAIRTWQMFNMPWMRLYWPNAPIQVGTTVAVSIHHFGFYSLNACRIVYLVDEDGATKRFGFAYGTLAEHAECGEERFTVEWHHADDAVWYDILAFSRPQKTLARLGYPLSRSLQRRFVDGSKSAMLEAVSST